MTRDEFLRSLDDQLGLPAGTLKGPEELESLEQWDSMAMVGFIALVDSNNGLKLSPKQIAACCTVQDLLNTAQVQD